MANKKVKRINTYYNRKIARNYLKLQIRKNTIQKLWENRDKILGRKRVK